MSRTHGNHKLFNSDALVVSSHGTYICIIIWQIRSIWSMCHYLGQETVNPKQHSPKKDSKGRTHEPKFHQTADSINKLSETFKVTRATGVMLLKKHRQEIKERRGVWRRQDLEAVLNLGTKQLWKLTSLSRRNCLRRLLGQWCAAEVWPVPQTWRPESQRTAPEGSNIRTDATTSVSLRRTLDTKHKVVFLPGPEFWRAGCVCRRPEVCGAARQFWDSPLEAQRRRPRRRRGCTPLRTLQRDKQRAQTPCCGQHALPVFPITDLKLCGCIYRRWTLRRDVC